MDLETLQYDLLNGKQYSYDGENPFERTKMRMGIYDITLDSIQVVSETDHTYYIQGSNFTPSSQVKINGEWYDTVYVNPTKLSHDRAVYALLSDSKWKLDSEKSSTENTSDTKNVG